MKIKFLTIAIACFMVSSVFGQGNINDYKYVIVPNKFDFLKEKDQYQINSLTKFLFNKHGFIAVMEGTEFPNDLKLNRCLALNSDVVKGQGMFKTKLTVELRDCNTKLIYTSQVGESREKEFKKAYNLALRSAFKSIETLKYKYEPNNSIVSLGGSNQSQVKTEASAEIQQLKKEIQNLKKEKEAEVIIAEQPKPVVPVPAVTQTQSVKKTSVIEGISNVLYAQAIDNGFQLVDSSPKVVYRIKNTNLKDVYLVEGSSAIVYKKDNDWVIEYYSAGTLEQEALNIKF